MARRISWSDLPEELLEDIAHRLNTGIDDDIRFRSVCMSWRRSGTPLSSHSIPPPASIKLPSSGEDYEFSFTESGSKVYRLEPEPSLNLSSSSKSWLIRVDEKAPTKLHMLIPQIQSPLKVLNLSEFRITEICTAYTLLRRVGVSNYASMEEIISKVVFRPSNPGVDNYVALAINLPKKRLAFVNSGEEEWSEIYTDDEGDCFSDIINYNGKFYAVDFGGKTIVVDAFSKVVIDRVASPMCDGGGNKKYLVECCGCLLLVDRYAVTRVGFQTRITTFEVYRLDEQGHNWVEVGNLGDQMLFVNNSYSFSASARDFNGCKGNSIYFTNVVDSFSLESGIKHQYSGVFDLKDGRILTLDCQPATLVKRDARGPDLDGLRLDLSWTEFEDSWPNEPDLSWTGFEDGLDLSWTGFEGGGPNEPDLSWTEFEDGWLNGSYTVMDWA